MKKSKCAAVVAATLAVTAVGVFAAACGDKDDEDFGVTYSVTYDAGGATGTVPTEVNHAKGDTFTLAQATGLTYEGKVFDKWNDGKNDYAAGATYTMPAAKVTFTAKWKNADGEETYAVTYDLNGGTGTIPTETDKAQGATFTLAASTGFTYSGKDFDKWNDGTADYDACATYTMPGHAVTFTAKWKNAESGEQSDPIFTNKSNAYIAIKEAGYDGYIELSADGSGVVYIENATTHTPVVDDTITYTVSDGTLTVSGKGEGSRLQTPVSGTITGRKVNITLENESANGTKVPFEFESELYKLTVNFNDGTRENYVQYVPAGITKDFSDVTAPNGKELSVVEVDGQNMTPAQVTELAMVAKDVTVKYVWTTTAAFDCTVTYKAGEGATGTDFVVEHVTNAQYTLLHPNYPGSAETPNPEKPTFSKQGYRFGGWMVDGHLKAPGDTVTLTGNADIVAVWNEVFYVSYAGVTGADISTNFVTEEQAAQDSNLTATPTDYTSNSAYYLPSGTSSFPGVIYFTKTGKALKGWTSSDDEGTENAGKVYAPSTKYTVTKNVTFTAVWDNPPDASEFTGKYKTSTPLTIGSYEDIAVIEFDGVNKLTLYADGDQATVTLTTTELDGNAVKGTGLLAIYEITVVLTETKVQLSVKTPATTAEFVPAEFDVTFVAPTGATGEAPAVITVSKATQYKCTLPDNTFTMTGWTFKGWQVPGKPFPQKKDTQQTFEDDATLTAVFKKQFSGDYGNIWIYTDGTAYESTDDYTYVPGSDYFYTYTVNNGIYTLYDSNENMCFQITISGSTYKALDGMQNITFTATNGTTTLTFNGLGKATIAGVQCDYTLNYEDNKLSSITLSNGVTATLPVSFDSSYNPSVNAKVSVSGTEYTFGKPSVQWSFSYEVTGSSIPSGTVMTTPGKDEATITNLNDGSSLTAPSDDVEFGGWKVKDAQDSTASKTSVTINTNNAVLVPVWVDKGSGVQLENTDKALSYFSSANGVTPKREYTCDQALTLTYKNTSGQVKTAELKSFTLALNYSSIPTFTFLNASGTSVTGFNGKDVDSSNAITNITAATGNVAYIASGSNSAGWTKVASLTFGTKDGKYVCILKVLLDTEGNVITNGAEYTFTGPDVA